MVVNFQQTSVTLYAQPEQLSLSVWACSQVEFHFDSHLCGYLSLLKLLSLWSELVGCYLPCLVRSPLTALALLPCNSLRSDFELTEWISGRIHIDYYKETTYQCLAAVQLFLMVPEYSLLRLVCVLTFKFTS